VEAAIADGIDVRGWFHRSAIDGYEWRSGFRVPYGLFDRDRNAKGSVEALTSAIAATA
jgi:beta-glucosidase